MASILDRAILQIESLLENWQYTSGHSVLHAVAQLPGSERILGRISRASEIEDLRDYLVEVDLALAFVGLGFAVEVEPLGKKGPDLRLELDGNTLLAEVSRLRLQHEMPIFDLLAPSPMLSELGGPFQDVRRAYQKVCNKLHQLSSMPGILVIWNDDEILAEPHFRTAVHWIQEEIAAGRLEIARNLLLIAYHTRWVSSKTNQEFFTWSPPQSRPAWLASWQARIEGTQLEEALRIAVKQLNSSN
jgi:hypothetical protein